MRATDAFDRVTTSAAYGERLAVGWPLDRRLRLLKWLSIIVPAIAVFALEMLRHQVIEPWLFGRGALTIPLVYSNDAGNLVVGALAFLLAYAFGQTVFGVIARMQQTLVRRNAELAALNAVAATAGASLAVEEIVDRSGDTLQRLFPADRVCIVPAGSVESRDPVPVPSSAPARIRRAEVRIPLQARERGYGAVVLTRAAGEFTPAECQLLRAIGDTLSVALENARLHEQVHEAAIVEERGRIAREMHDGVAQLLAFVLVKLNTVDDLVARGAVEDARQELETLRQAAEGTYVDVRDQILGLRLVGNPQLGLATLLRGYVDDFIDQTALPTELVVGGGVEQPVPREAELQAIRIVQEALTNVRKHSGARSATVRCGVYGDELVVTVEDDGRGFVVSQPGDRPGRHFGLLVMRERAESLGGRLEIVSTPGAGTRIQVGIPLAGGLPENGVNDAADLVAPGR